jgi:penicillin-binding protein-related factor A (putative recombinase)
MGKKSKRVGNIFQEDFTKSVPKNILIERYKDSPTRFKHVDNPADFWINAGGYVLLVECKSTGDSNLPLGNIGMGQVWKMLIATSKVNTFGGFAINFRKYDQTYFVFVSDFINWYLGSHGSSLPLVWIKTHGYRISSRMAISRSRYGVKGLLDWVREVKVDGISGHEKS